jgi:hypothetical protein
MTGAPDPHPAPHAEKLSTGRALFMLFGGPLAWFVQLCISVPLLGWPCFPAMDRYVVPMPNYAWTRAGAIVLLAACVGVALAAGIVSLSKLREVRNETDGGHAELIEVGHGRTRFTALWGVVLGFGFAIATFLTLIPFLMVSRCAG